MCYLKSTPTHGLVYKPSTLSLVAYADADYAGDLDDRISIGRILYISWPKLCFLKDEKATRRLTVKYRG